MERSRREYKVNRIDNKPADKTGCKLQKLSH